MLEPAELAVGVDRGNEQQNHLVHPGPPDRIRKSRRSLTGKYMSGRPGVPVPDERRKGTGTLTLKGAALHNLKKVTARFPLRTLNVVTGVSGSGKSSLVSGLLVPAVRAELEGEGERPEAMSGLTGLGNIDKLLVIDQSPLGRSPHSNPATYSGAFGEIRSLFAATAEARMRGFGPGRFSCNVKGGRCEACQGRGVEIVEMHFLSDVSITCEACNGRRYGRETLEVRWKGHTIADVLDMDVDAALEAFGHHKRIARKLSFLSRVGLGYLKLGQPATTLSGGEAQRVKLATELAKGDSPATPLTRPPYVLDEPTTGLHFEDINKLMSVFHRLADAGASLVVIEHNLDVLQGADWIIDLGPEGGGGGGQIVATGTPEDVAKIDASHTGRYLRSVLN